MPFKEQTEAGLSGNRLRNDSALMALVLSLPRSLGREHEQFTPAQNYYNEISVEINDKTQIFN